MLESGIFCNYWFRWGYLRWDRFVSAHDQLGPGSDGSTSWRFYASEVRDRRSLKHWAVQVLHCRDKRYSIIWCDLKPLWVDSFFLVTIWRGLLFPLPSLKYSQTFLWILFWTKLLSVGLLLVLGFQVFLKEFVSFLVRRDHSIPGIFGVLNVFLVARSSDGSWVHDCLLPSLHLFWVYFH